MAFIEARDLVKTYTPKGAPVVRALDGLDLDVAQGTVTALLGPNGAGKTTTVKVLTTLIQPDSGTATIDDVDVLRDPDRVRRMIGASGQYAAVDENLTGFENLMMVGKLYHLGAKVAKQRARELIEMFDLVDAANRPVKGFSGGMRRRIDLAGALVINPPVLFLDEPTTGLDPRSRLALWDIIESLVSGGTTVLLTTQYLEEADRLADAISVIDNGRVIAKGTADELKASVGGQRVAVTLVSERDAVPLRDIMSRFGAGAPVEGGGGRTWVVPVDNGPVALSAIVGAAAEQNIALHDAGMRRPTLDDVFLQLTGHAAEQADETEGEAA
ncbi:ABC-2 type transport system ATP-binding protein [Microcella putealis]|uniref:ABC-2 type transport system ATP-binding protein n=1 Tax=Microcella putealis TaxID=337005 RepID=A0A4Q7LPZ1_9MICO|nr:ATP-binding cassette domain-containing protein [Microcella putealis]RZS56333.1 ABC-2 type transport system ATP-binding protein [Microcella putealis]TQM27181.1 ABC-2 type transport system ATP-binding protein [Microcella putealis]